MKRIRLQSKEGPEKITKVCRLTDHLPCLSIPMKPTDTLPGRCTVEKFGAPKHSSFPRDYFHSSPDYFRMDARRRFDGIHQEISGRRPTRPRGCPSSHFRRYIHPCVSYEVSLRVFTISTLATWFMEISRAYVIILNLISPLY